MWDGPNTCKALNSTIKQDCFDAKFVVACVKLTTSKQVRSLYWSDCLLHISIFKSPQIEKYVQGNKWFEPTLSLPPLARNSGADKLKSLICQYVILDDVYRLRHAIQTKGTFAMKRNPLMNCHYAFGDIVWNSLWGNLDIRWYSRGFYWHILSIPN